MFKKIDKIDKSDYVASSSKKYLGMRGAPLHKAIATIAGLGFLLFGYDQGVMGSLLTLDSFLETFPQINDSVDTSKSTLKGFVIAVYELGCMTGAFFTMWKGDIFGRRKMIFYGSIIMTIGGILQCTSYSVAQLAVARVVSGVGNGFITSTIPTLQSECAKPHRRGALIMMSGALISFGICFSYWVDFGLYFATGDVQWRFPIAFQIVFSLLLTSLIFELPESPRWLVKIHEIERARETFAALDDVSVDDPLIDDEIKDIQAVLKRDADAGADKFSFSVVFKFDEKKTFHRTMLAYFVQVMQQISGINLITYYAGTIYETYIGMNALDSRILAACNGTEYFLASLIPFYTVERFGRRSLFLFGTAGQAITMAILTGVQWASEYKGDQGAAIACAVFLFVFNTFFAIGMLGMTWLLPPELVTLESRASVTGLSTSANWLFNFVVVMITPVCFTHIGPYTYTIFAVVNAIMVPCIFFFYPETKGRSLEEMDRIFEQSNPKTPWDVVRIAREMPFENRDIDNEDEEDKINLDRSSETSSVSNEKGSASFTADSVNDTGFFVKNEENKNEQETSQPEKKE